MARLIALAVVLTISAVVVGASWWLATAEDRRQRRQLGRDAVLEDAIQDAARANYRLLARSVRAHQRVLDADAVIPSLSRDLRDELLAVVTEFNTNQLPKGP